MGVFLSQYNVAGTTAFGVPGLDQWESFEDQFGVCSVSCGEEELLLEGGGGNTTPPDAGASLRPAMKHAHGAANVLEAHAVAVDPVGGVLAERPSELNYGAHVCKIRIPGKLEQYFYLSVLASERPQFILHLQELKERYQLVSGFIDNIIGALERETLDVDEMPEVTGVDYRQMNFGDVIQFGTLMSVLMTVNYKHCLFVGVKVSLDTVYQEMLTTKHRLEEHQELGLIHVEAGMLISFSKLIVAFRQLFEALTKKEAGAKEINFYCSSHQWDDSYLSVPERFGRDELVATDHALSMYERAFLYVLRYPLASVLAVHDMEVVLETGHPVPVTQIVFGYETFVGTEAGWAVAHHLISPMGSRLVGDDTAIINRAMTRRYINPKTHKTGTVMIQGSFPNISIALPKKAWNRENAWRRKAPRIASAFGQKFPLDPNRIQLFKSDDDGSYVCYHSIKAEDLSQSTAEQIMASFDAIVLLVSFLLDAEIKGDQFSNLDFEVAIQVLEEKLTTENLSDLGRAKVNERIRLYRQFAETLQEIEWFKPFVQETEGDEFVYLNDSIPA